MKNATLVSNEASMRFDFLSDIKICQETEKQYINSGSRDVCSYVVQFDYEAKVLFIEQEKEMHNEYAVRD